MEFEKYEEEIKKILNRDLKIKDLIREIVLDVMLLYEDYISRGYSYDITEHGLCRTELRRYRNLGEWMENEPTGEKELSLTGYIYPNYERKIAENIAKKLKEEFIDIKLPDEKRDEISGILRELMGDILEYIKMLNIEEAERIIKNRSF